jgi:hypothetical protein
LWGFASRRCNFSEGREQYYIDLFKPEYNILPTAGSSLGFKYTEESKTKMSECEAPHKNQSEETKAKISAALGAAIEVLDLETNISANYASLRAAARALNISHAAILKNINSKYQKAYKGKYIIKSI